MKNNTGRPYLVSPRTVRIMQRQIEMIPRTKSPQLKEKNTKLVGKFCDRPVCEYLHCDLSYKHCVARKKTLIN